MTEFNPLAGSLLSSSNVQRQLSLERSRQRRRAQVLEKNAAATGDELMHSVESIDQLPPIEEQFPEHGRPSRERPADDPSGISKQHAHIDLTG